MYLVLQMVIAVILENIESQTKIESMAITQKHINVSASLAGWGLHGGRRLRRG